MTWYIRIGTGVATSRAGADAPAEAKAEAARSEPASVEMMRDVVMARTLGAGPNGAATRGQQGANRLLSGS